MGEYNKRDAVYLWPTVDGGDWFQLLALHFVDVYTGTRRAERTRARRRRSVFPPLSCLHSINSCLCASLFFTAPPGRELLCALFLYSRC